MPFSKTKVQVIILLILSREEAIFYLENRREKKFNGIQAVLLAEWNGLMAPNPYGSVPLLQNSDGFYDSTMPDAAGDYSYWDHVDWILDRAEEKELYVALLPT